VEIAEDLPPGKKMGVSQWVSQQIWRNWVKELGSDLHFPHSKILDIIAAD